MLLSKMILDIIDFKTELNLLESDFTFEGAVDWYCWAIPMGLVETEYDREELVGYAEWVRLPTIPTDFNSITLQYDKIKTAPILLVANLAAKDKEVLMRLKQKIAEHNPDWTTVVWHHKDKGFRTFNRTTTKE